jgi:hypothetical protein
MDAWDLHYHAKGSIVRLRCQWFMLVNVDDMLVSIDFFKLFHMVITKGVPYILSWTFLWIRCRGN